MIFLSLSTIFRLHHNGTKPQHQQPELMCFTAVQKTGPIHVSFWHMPGIASTQKKYIGEVLPTAGRD